MARKARRTPLLTLTLLSLAGTATADAPSESDAGLEADRRERVVVRGKGVEITVGEVEDALLQQGPLARVRYRTADDLKQLVSSLVRTELLAVEAKKRGYEQDPTVRHTVKESAAQALVRQEIEDKITPQSIPLEDVKAYYESHAAEFHRVAMRRASIVVLDDESAAKQLMPVASKADARQFSELAKQQSKHLESKQQGGDLGYFAAKPDDDGGDTQVAPELRAAAFALKQVGDTSEPVRFGEKYAIVRLAGERPERHASLDDAAPSIRAKLWRERRQQALDELLGKLRSRDKPQVFADRVQRISFDDMEKRPSGFAPDPAPLATTLDAAVKTGR